MLIDNNQPKSMWSEAIFTANYIINRSPTSALKSQTPFEMWLNRKPDLSKLRVFGAKAYAHVPKERRTSKFDERSKLYYMMGYNENGYRLWCPESRSIVVSRDVKFQEDSLASVRVVSDPNEQTESEINECKDEYLSPEPVKNEEPDKTPVQCITPKVDPAVLKSNRYVGRTKFGRDVIKLKRLDLNDPETHLALNADFSDETPLDYRDIEHRPDKAEWRSAVETELTDEPYRALMGSLMYLMLGSRPDLCFALGMLSRYQDKATNEHWQH